MSVVARQMVLIRDMKGAKEKHQDRVFAAIQGIAGNTSRKGGKRQGRERGMVLIKITKNAGGF